MTLSERMAQRLDLFKAAPMAVARRLWEGSDLRRTYPALLLLQLDTIRASADLMREAAAQLDLRPEDPLAAELAAYYRHHAEEEAGHVAWVEADLGVLGAGPEALASRPPSPHAASLVGAQYYWMRHAHPVALLGYLITLEWATPDPAAFDRAAGRSGLPPEAFTCFRRHAQLDPGHRAEMAALLDRLPFTEAQEALMGLSLIHSCQGVATLYEAALAS